MKLLIVDDSSMMRRTIESQLKHFDFEIVGHAANGKEALELFRSNKPDFVTLDITMPKMNGIECLEEMMKLAPKTKVIMITALSDKYTGLEALKKGALEFLYKPITLEQLKESFDSLINNKKNGS